MALPKGLAAVLAKSPSDTVILSSLRTPICRSYKGQLKDAYPEELLSVVLRATLDANPNLPPEKIDDVAVGVVLSELGGSKASRMAMNHVGYATTTSLHTVNRACSSSLQSIAAISAQIRTGMIDVGVAAGTESMTRNYGSRAIPVDLWPALRESGVRDARDCIMPMGLTSENVAERYGVSRAEQDAFAAESHRRAARAQESGAFDAEIVPVTTRFQEVDRAGEKVGGEKTITVTRDDGVRPGVTTEALARLKPAFKPDGGSSTAGNSSQVSDGAAATLLMRRSTAAALGLSGDIVGRFVAGLTAGCRPDEMGVGPKVAIPALLARLGLGTRDVHRWEINEAFASQAVYCVRELGLQGAWERGEVNPDGGAIALGHPLGATGARLASTLLHGLGRTGGEVGVHITPKFLIRMDVSQEQHEVSNPAMGFLISPVDVFAYKRHALYPFLIAHHPSSDGSHNLDMNVTKNAQILARVCNEIFQGARGDTSRRYLFSAVSSKLSAMYTYWKHTPAHTSELQQFILDLCTSRSQFLNIVRSGDTQPYDDDLTKNIDAINARLSRAYSPNTGRMNPADRKRSTDSEQPVSKRRRGNDGSSEGISNAEPPPLTTLYQQIMAHQNNISRYQREVGTYLGEVKDYKSRVSLLEKSLKIHQEPAARLCEANDSARANTLGDLGKRLWAKVSKAANKEATQGGPGDFGDSIEEVERFLKEDIRVLVMRSQMEDKRSNDADEDSKDSASAVSPLDHVNLPYRPAPTSMRPDLTHSTTNHVDHS
ncbi:Thiolase, N-terminal domain-containing protein [Biscogniauxia mediterranea]|nr:Thiolase, N-terminal domain-containing protein [Biscogniauxia mediterranea]